MKALIKGGLCVALGWLANGAYAQEIQWRASTPKNTSPIAVVSTPGTSTVKSEVGIRSVGLSQPVPLDVGAVPSAFRPLAPTIRGQAPDDKTVPAVPKLEVGGKDPKVPRPLPKDNGFVPPPPMNIPSPIFGGLGMSSDGGFHDGCGSSTFNSGTFGGTDCCPPRPRFWASGEYLMWWQRAQNVPPLVVASPGNADPILGLNSTTILYDRVPDGMRGGGRFALGMWMPHFCCNLGIETNFFFLGRNTTTASFTGAGNGQFARPFFDVNNNDQSFERFDGLNASGRSTIQTFTQLWGIEGNLRYKWRCGPTYWLDVIGGYRHLNLSEGINITEDVQGFNVLGAPGVRVLEQESFRTRNQFNGTQIGLDGECRLGNRWFLGGTVKVAMGNIHQIINIDGTTTFTNVPNPPGNSVQQGALLATPTNIGRFTDNRFGVLPEVSLKIGLDVTDSLRFFVGYDFLYLNNVVRPGDQIDLRVNENFRPSIFGPGVGGGPQLPSVPFRTTGYWAQGINFGMQYRY